MVDRVRIYIGQTTFSICEIIDWCTQHNGLNVCTWLMKNPMQLYVYERMLILIENSTPFPLVSRCTAELKKKVNCWLGLTLSVCKKETTVKQRSTPVHVIKCQIIFQSSGYFIHQFNSIEKNINLKIGWYFLIKTGLYKILLKL